MVSMALLWNQLDDLPPETRTPFFVSIVITAVITLFSVAGYLIIQPEIPLFFSLPLTDVLVPKIWVLLFPLLALVVTVVHITLVWLARAFEILIIKLFAWMTVVLLGILLATLVRLLWLVL